MEYGINENAINMKDEIIFFSRYCMAEAVQASLSAISSLTQSTTFHEMLSRATSSPTPVVQAAMVDQLRVWHEEVAAERYVRY